MIHWPRVTQLREEVGAEDFEEVVDLCQDGERQSAAGHADTVDLDAIINSFEASKSVFQSELPGHI